MSVIEIYQQPRPAAVLELSPNGNGSWTETIAYNFEGGPDGSPPDGRTDGPIFGSGLQICS